MIFNINKLNFIEKDLNIFKYYNYKLFEVI